MANTFLNDQMYANVMLLLVKNNLVMGKLVDTRFENQVSDKNGLQIFVKRPPRFVMTSGPTLDTQDITVGSTSMKVDQYSGVHLSITDLQYVQSYNELMQTQTMKSAASTLAQGVDSYLMGFLKQFPSWVQAPAAAGTVDKPFATVQQEIPVWSALEEMAVPSTDRVGVMSTLDAAGIQGNLIDKFMTAEAANAMKKARIPMLSDIDYYRTQNTVALTTGTRSSTTGSVNGATNNVDYVTVKDTMVQVLPVLTFTGAATIKAGEVFTIAGVFRINPRSQQIVVDATGASVLQQFTVVADATMTAGAGNITISPPIIVPGTGGTLAIQRTNTAFGTASAVPGNGALLTFAGAPSSTFRQRAAWHKSAIQMVSARLITPMTGVSSFASDPGTGITIRYWRGSDIATGNHVHRWDMIYGATVVDPLLGTRFSGL